MIFLTRYVERHEVQSHLADVGAGLADRRGARARGRRARLEVGAADESWDSIVELFFMTNYYTCSPSKTMYYDCH